MEISLDQSVYTVNEGIGASNRALQICAEAKDLIFLVPASIQVHNGSAIGRNLTLISHT